LAEPKLWKCDTQAGYGFDQITAQGSRKNSSGTLRIKNMSKSNPSYEISSGNVFADIEIVIRKRPRSRQQSRIDVCTV
jgi:hypothetical protein